MFETLAFSDGPASKRVWTTFLAMSAEAAVVAAAVLIPLAFPNMLPRPLAPVAWLLAPAAPVRVEPTAARPASAHALRATPVFHGVVYQPHSFPAKPLIVEDAPADFAPPGAIAGEWDAAGNLLKGILEAGARIPLAAPARALPVVPRPAPPPRVTLGSDVKEAVLLQMVEPIYPELARQARVSGRVELDGVIGTDGRIRELKPRTGSPLLIPAAMDAVRQWLYKPALLNGAPAEVELMIVVNFRLN